MNAACRPSFLRASGGARPAGIARTTPAALPAGMEPSSTLARLAKLLRMRFFSVNEYSVMHLDLVGSWELSHAGDFRMRPDGALQSTGREHCAPLRMVAGHYQPLADSGSAITLHIARPNLSSAVGSEDKESKLVEGWLLPVSRSRRFACLQPLDATAAPTHDGLGHRSAACPLKRPDAANRVYLISTLAPASSSFFFAASASALLMPSLTAFGAPSTRSLASFRPRPVQLANGLDHVDLVFADGEQHDGELGLLFGGGRGGGAAGSGRRGNRERRRRRTCLPSP